jgi:hypothetical protein
MPSFCASSGDAGWIGPAGQEHLAAAGRQHARQHLDERGLARAVLPHQRMDLAGVQVQLHVTQHRDAAELLVDAPSESTGVRVSSAMRAHLFLL